MPAVIQVENLGKRYRIDHDRQHHAQYKTLRDALTDAAMMPLRRWRNRGSDGRREDFWALTDVNFEIQPGEVVGIIGRNGAGKSTLLKILSRITKPTTGQATLHGRVGSLLEVGTGFHPELTGRENIFLNGSILGMTRKEIQKQFDAIVDFSGVEKFLDTPVKRYSSGMYVRLAFAVAAHLNPEILIVDEVLSVGDSEFQRKCLGKMKNVASSGRTVLFVSHNLAAVQGLCSHGMLLASGKICQFGEIASVIDSYLAEAKSPEAAFNDGPLKWLRAQVVDDSLQIEAAYEHITPLSLPSLGFVVSDHLGRPVMGLNPRMSGIDRAARPSSSGLIRASITSPRLNDGHYRLSVWFGDGFRDFVSYTDCITFDVRAWAGPRQLPARIVGSVVPVVEWDFDPADIAARSECPRC